MNPETYINEYFKYLKDEFLFLLMTIMNFMIITKKIGYKIQLFKV